MMTIAGDIILAVVLMAACMVMLAFGSALFGKLRDSVKDRSSRRVPIAS